MVAYKTVERLAGSFYAIRLLLSRMTESVLGENW
jgi:hypothetical protein